MTLDCVEVSIGLNIQLFLFEHSSELSFPFPTIVLNFFIKMLIPSHPVPLLVQHLLNLLEIDVLDKMLLDL